MENGPSKKSSSDGGLKAEEAARMKVSGYVGLTDKVSDFYDSDLYGSLDKGEYMQHIAPDIETENDHECDGFAHTANKLKALAFGSGYGSQKQSVAQVHAAAKADVLKSSDKNSQDDDDDFKNNSAQNKKSVTYREDDYRRQRLNRLLSPMRADPFGSETPGSEVRSYSDVMMEQQLDKEKAEVIKLIRQKKQSELLTSAGILKADKSDNFNSNKLTTNGSLSNSNSVSDVGEKNMSVDDKKKRRWDTNDDLNKKTKGSDAGADASRWDTPSHGLISSNDDISTPNVWEETPVRAALAPNKSGDGVTPVLKRNRWDSANSKLDANAYGETPTPQQWGETPTVGYGATLSAHASVVTNASKPKRSSRWDATPLDATPSSLSSDTPMGAVAGATPMGISIGETPGEGMMTTPTPYNSQHAGTPTPSYTPGGPTPIGMTSMHMATPITPTQGSLAPDEFLTMRIQSENEERNRFLTDAELDEVMPSEGYEIVAPPADYNPPIRRSLGTPGITAKGGVTATPTPMLATPLYSLPDASPLTGGAQQMQSKVVYDIGGGAVDLGDIDIKPEDYQYFNKLFQPPTDDDDALNLSREEINERKVLTLLLKIKNGSPPIRRAALRTITDRAKEFGSGIQAYTTNN